MSGFSPHPSTPSQPIPTPSPTSTLPLDFCPCALYSSSCNPPSPLSPPHSPLVIVTRSSISMSLVIFCLLFAFVDYVPVKGEIIWYLSLCNSMDGTRFFHGLFHLHHVSSSHLYHNSQVNITRPYVSSEIKTLTISPSTYLKSPLMCPKCTLISSCPKQCNVLSHIHHMRSSPCALSLTTIR